MDADKEKIQNLISQQRRTLAEVGYLDLNFAAKIAEDFENPKLPDENLKKILRKGFTSLTPHKQP